jgi:hypothetical protein
MGSLRLAGACVAAVLIGGCGGSSDRAGLSPAVDRGELRFARCMRAHGIDVADHHTRPGHSGLTLDIPPRGPQTRTAYAACGRYLQPLIETKLSHVPTVTGARRLGLIHYAECMREHGISMLDPTPQGSLNLGNLPGFNNSIGRYSPPFRFADSACKHLLPHGVFDNGNGP